MKNKKEILDYITIILVVSYSYLRMLGMNDRRVLIAYILILYIFMFCRVINTKFKKKELYKIIFFLAINVFSIIFIDEVDMVIPTIVAIILLRTDSESIIKKFFIISVIWYILIIVIYLLGITENNNIIRVNEDMIKTRYSLGFDHVNQPFLYVLPIIFCLYLLYSNKKILLNISIIAIATVLYIFTDCRTGYFSVLIFIIIYNIQKIIDNKIYNKLFKYFFIFFTIVTIIIASNYGEDGSNKINEILSLRPFYIRKYIEQDNIINLCGGNYMKEIPLDNLYIYILEEKGFILYLIYASIYLYSATKFEKSIKYKTIMTVFFIYGLFEAYIILPAINFMLILQIRNIILEEKEFKILEEVDKDG